MSSVFQLVFNLLTYFNEYYKNVYENFFIYKVKIHKIIKEIGSGINDSRVKLTNLLISDDYTKIVIEHKDRLTRIGFNYIKILLENKGKQIEVINECDSDKEDLIQDFVSIITSYCAKIYDKRRSNRKTEQLIKKLKEDNN